MVENESAGERKRTEHSSPPKMAPKVKSTV